MDIDDPDSKLMVAYQQGDCNAFDHLLDKYHRPIVNFVYKFVNNAAEAEDLAQEVFLRIHRARSRYEPRAKFSAWIFRIAANLTFKELRRKRRAGFWSRNHHSEGQADYEQASIPDPLPDSERRLLASEMGRVIRRAVLGLPDKEKLALVLRRYEEMSYRDIAEVMNCTEGAVKTYIHRGKLHVRDRILPYLEKGSAR
jgi:RNA polymerase sigma-70 factor (ECF subfamily)